MKSPDPEPGDERHQRGKRNQEPVGPYAIRYPRREWTHHRKVTSPWESDHNLQNIVAYLRILQKSPPRDESDQRSGRSSERSLRVPILSFVRTFTIVVCTHTKKAEA